MSLESFKLFVRNRPELAQYVRNKEMSWQDFYDLYDLYGESNSIWDKYKSAVVSSSVSFRDILSSFKNIDMDEIQKGIGSLQKGIGYLQDLVSKKEVPEIRESTYTPRPIHKHFDD